MTLTLQAKVMLPAIEAELKRQVRRIGGGPLAPFQEMLAYHLGWVPSMGSSKRRGGKRIRPLLTLLACASVGGRWQEAVSAAAALELVHNFSLVHDDIQDNSPTRRGRETLWKRQGVPLALNAGDALHALANLAALDLMTSHATANVVTAAGILQQASLDLTKGQFLDLYHQQRGELTLPGYWRMIDGKTAALLAACAQIGALLGGASARKCYEYRKFGQLLGRAFQVEDDILGIWGEEGATGKSAATDLQEGKLSLPVVYGLSKRGEFARRWRTAGARAKHAGKLRSLLEAEGGLAYSRLQADKLTRAALRTFRHLRVKGEAGAALEDLAMRLLTRNN